MYSQYVQFFLTGYRVRQPSNQTLDIGLEVNVDDAGDLVGQREEVVAGLVHQVALSSQSVTFLLLVLSLFHFQFTTCLKYWVSKTAADWTKTIVKAH